MKKEEEKGSITYMLKMQFTRLPVDKIERNKVDR